MVALGSFVVDGFSFGKAAGLTSWRFFYSGKGGAAAFLYAIVWDS